MKRRFRAGSTNVMYVVNCCRSSVDKEFEKKLPVYILPLSYINKMRSQLQQISFGEKNLLMAHTIQNSATYRKTKQETHSKIQNFQMMTFVKGKSKL